MGELLEGYLPRNRFVSGLVLLLLVLLIAGLYWFFGGSGEPPSVQWEETTVPYEKGCEPDCEPIQPVASKHGPEAVLLYNPEIDDPVAQWSDGLSSVMSCLDGADPGNSSKLPSCVQESSFPDQCKKRFASTVDKTAEMETQLKTFEKIFVDEGGYCVPE